MFYSQIVLSKKGPLGKVWLAAHHDKKLSRPQIFAFDISDSVHNIVHPVVPLALRVSGHLLLGVVRIYSRKVHYLMEDAHEASIKISTAFTAQPTLDLVLASTKPGRNPDHHLNVANFGEFQPMAFLEGGFEIPTDLVGEDWDVADDDDDDGTEDGNDDDNDGDEPARKRQRSSNNLPPDDSLEQSQSLSSSLLDATGNHNNRRSVAAGETSDLTTSGLLNENWPAFNPDDDDEEEEENESKHSSLPEIEVTRAADNTFASDSQVRGPSALGDDSLTSFPKRPDSPSVGSNEEFPPPDDDAPMGEEEVLHPFDDDEEGTQVPPESRASLALSVSHETSLVDGQVGTATTAGGGGGLSVSGLEDSHDQSGVGGLSTGSLEKDKDDEDHSLSSSGEFHSAIAAAAAATPVLASPSKKRPNSAIRRRKRRIRKIDMDTDDTRLSADEIREHLHDPSDLQVRQISPSTWLPGVPVSEQPPVYPIATVDELIERSMPIERYLARPNIADDGSLCPKLLNLWLRNMAPAMGKPFAYELRTTTTPPEAAEDPDGAVEVTRRQDAGGDESVEQPSGPKLTDEEDDQTDFPPPDDDDDEQPPANDDAPMPFDDDEDNIPPPMDDESTPKEDETVGDDQADDSIGRSRVSGLSLGLVNDFGRDLDDDDDETAAADPRQDQGDELVSSSTKWHKHTVKVYDMIHRNMPTIDSGRPRQLLFDTICDSVSRRTACGVFFELLQLKTWDIVELDQAEFFGDMKISPGLKFDEVPPTST